MPPKKNIKKVKVTTLKPKAKPKAKAKAKAKAKTIQPTQIDNRKITDKRQTQSVNVNVSVGKETERSSKVRDESKSQTQTRGTKIPTRTTAPTIIPQYIQGNPPPMPPTPQPPIMMTQQIPPITIPKVKPTPPIMTSLGSLDDVPETISLRSYRSYDVSEPVSELTSESYKYSVSDIPSGINLESVKSTSPMSAIDLLRDLKKKVLEPREPFREIIQGDGSIKLISEEKPSTLDMSMIDQPADEKQYEQMSISERIQEEENKKKRGRKPGSKNRPKEELEAEREADKKKKEEKVQKREEKVQKEVKERWIKTQKGWEKEQIMQGNRDWTANQLDRILGEPNRFDELNRMLDERDISKLKEI